MAAYMDRNGFKTAIVGDFWRRAEVALKDLQAERSAWILVYFPKRVKGYIFQTELQGLSQTEILGSLIQPFQLFLFFDRRYKYTNNPLQSLGLCKPQCITK